MKLTNTRRQPSSVSFNAVFLGKRTYFSLSWKWPTYRSSHMHGRRLRDPFARRANLQRFKCSNHRSHTRFFLLMLLPCYTQALRGGPTQHQQVPDTHTHTHALTRPGQTCCQSHLWHAESFFMRLHQGSAAAARAGDTVPAHTSRVCSQTEAGTLSAAKPSESFMLLLSRKTLYISQLPS